MGGVCIRDWAVIVRVGLRVWGCRFSSRRALANEPKFEVLGEALNPLFVLRAKLGLHSTSVSQAGEPLGLCVHRAMLFAQPDEYSVHQAGLKNNFIQQVILPARLPAELKPWVRRRLLRATLDLRKA